MSKYITCPECGAHLDSGEQCDCEKGRRSNDLSGVSAGED